MLSCSGGIETAEEVNVFASRLLVLSCLLFGVGGVWGGYGEGLWVGLKEVLNGVLQLSWCHTAHPPRESLFQEWKLLPSQTSDPGGAMQIPSWLWNSGLLGFLQGSWGSWKFTHPVYVCFVVLGRLMTMSLAWSCGGYCESMGY